MPKLEFTPIFDWQKFNFLSKRLFDVLNKKQNIITRSYVGNGTAQDIYIDLIPRLIIIFRLEDGFFPVIWIDIFGNNLAKRFDGDNLTDQLIISPKKDFFTVMDDSYLNEVDVEYNFLVIGE